MLVETIIFQPEDSMLPCLEEILPFPVWECNSCLDSFNFAAGTLRSTSQNLGGFYLKDLGQHWEKLLPPGRKMK
jgi:hypothetical protein